MCHKTASRLPVLRMNLQDFSGLTNEIPDWTDQSDKSLLCVLHQYSKQITMHLFCSCMIARWFWREFINWYNSLHSEKNTFRKRNCIWCAKQLVVFFNPQPLNPYRKVLYIQ